VGNKRTSSERQKGENSGAIKIILHTQVGVATAKLVGGARPGRLEGQRLFEFQKIVTEIYKESPKKSKEEVNRHGDRISFLYGDIFQPLPSMGAVGN
jgi:hypothetical protein